MSENIKADLKKSDLLAIITVAPMARARIVELASEEFQFLDSYADYLLDHFKAQGKVIHDEENDTWSRKQAAGATTRILYRVIEAEPVEGDDEVQFAVEAHTLEKGEFFNDEMKDEGYRQTPKAAVKVKTSEIFAQYKADTAKAKALLDEISDDE